ncbi:MAG TPA: lytic transglycosylase domain-containing protein [Thermoanaerobaculia bacterium]|nr:lytic transglycosylase domain-containing protein [Thermoanaerobaculia bacterium]
MDPIKTERPFEQRFLGGFERSRLKQEVLASKRKHKTLKQRYAGLVLGASLAIGGMGIGTKGSKLLSDAEQKSDSARNSPILEGISDDLKTARTIAQEVTGGVSSAMSILETPTGVKKTAQRTEQQMAMVTDSAKEAFFKTEIPFGGIIYQEALRNDISPELVAAVVKQESRFVPTARSHRGAQGLMQMVPKTGRWMGATNLMNPADNVKAGAKYLRYLSDRFDGDRTKIVAAYNAGEGNVRRFGGIPPFKETQKYVKKVFSYEQEFKDQLSGKTQMAALGNASAIAR